MTPTSVDGTKGDPKGFRLHDLWSATDKASSFKCSKLIYMSTYIVFLNAGLPNKGDNL